MSVIDAAKVRLKGRNRTVVFPEGTEPRILGAASRLQAEGYVKPILLGNPKKIKVAAADGNFNIEGIEIYDPNNYSEYDQMVHAFVQRRKGKATEEQAVELLRDVNYFGTMLCYMDKVDCMVSGSVHTTGETVRPALQIIKTKEGVSKISGAFIMISPEGEKYIFADCAINIRLTAEDLAEVAIQSAITATSFAIHPRVAMLSFSTKGSADDPDAERVAAGAKLAKELQPNLIVDGEMQFDAAFVERVAEQKAPDSAVAGRANVFIFPNLSAANIGYKIAQRLGGYEAIGPILQGLNKPVNDLSRGCNEEDVYKLALISATQSLE